MNQKKAGVVLSYVGIAANTLIQLLYTPVMLRLLGQQEYGIYNLAYSTVGYLGLLGFGFSSAYVRYYARYKEANKEEEIAHLNGLFLKVLLFVSAIALLAGSVLIKKLPMFCTQSLSSEELKETQLVMAVLIVNLAIGFPSSLFDSYIVAHDCFVAQKVIYLIRTILNPFLALPLLLMGYRSVSMAVVMTALTVLALIMNVVYCESKLHIQFRVKSSDWTLFKEIFSFCFFIFLNQVVNQLNWSTDQVLLGMYCSSAAVAVYAVANTLNNIYMQFSTSISNVYIPQVNRMVAKNCGEQELTNLFTHVGRLQFLVMGLICSGLIFFGRPFLNFYAGSEYGESYVAALLLILPVFIPLIQNLGIEIQRAKNMHHFRSIIYLLIAVSNVCISIPLTRRWGPTGAACGTAISMLLGNGIIMNLYYHYALKLSMTYFWKEIMHMARGLVLPVIMGIAVINRPWLYHLPCLGIFIMAYCALYGISMWFFGMNNSEKNQCKQIMRRFSMKSSAHN